MILLDRLSKAWAVDALEGLDAPIDAGLIDFTLVHNTGAAFGMGEGRQWLFVAITVCIVVAVVLWLVIGARHRALEVVALSLVVAGGIGNLIDRVSSGSVVDFIEFTFVDFPVFNVADICVTCGAVLFIIAVLTMDFGQADAAGAGEEDTGSEQELPPYGESSCEQVDAAASAAGEPASVDEPEPADAPEPASPDSSDEPTSVSDEPVCFEDARDGEPEGASAAGEPASADEPGPAGSAPVDEPAGAEDAHGREPEGASASGAEPAAAEPSSSSAGGGAA